jgi:hypothetical protein
MIPAFERAKTVHELDSATTVIGHIILMGHVHVRNVTRLLRRQTVQWPVESNIMRYIAAECLLFLNLLSTDAVNIEIILSR